MASTALRQLGDPPANSQEREQTGHRKGSASFLQFAITLSMLLLCTACGYHTAGHEVTLPSNVQTIAIPAFVNQTQTYKIEQKLRPPLSAKW